MKLNGGRTLDHIEGDLEERRRGAASTLLDGAAGVVAAVAAC